MAAPQGIEGTGRELEQYLKERPDERFRLVPVAIEGDRPFCETASTEEWIATFRDWAESHSPLSAPLSDEAISRGSIYAVRG